MTTIALPLRRFVPTGGLPVSLAVAYLVALVVAAVLAPLVAPHSPYATSLLDALAPPGTPGHLLGTDGTGRDTLSRLLFGARLSLVAPLGVIALATTAGTALGLVAARRGGWADLVISRAMDVVFAFPSLLLAMIAVAVFGHGMLAVVCALAIAYTPFVGRVVRSVAAQELVRPYVDSYRVMGFGAFYVTVRRVLPNLVPFLLAQAALGFGYALIDLASLSYLGLGVQPPDADWGTMINQSQSDLLQGSPWGAVVPGVAVLVTVIAVNVIGERISLLLSRREASLR